MVIVRSKGNEKSNITVELGVSANGRRLPPYVILKRKIAPKEQLPAGTVFIAQGRKMCIRDRYSAI